MSPVQCPCGSLTPFVQCCQPLLAGERHALTAEQLMRSRYTAYAVMDVEYVVNTWSNATRPTNLAHLIAQDNATTEWQGLTINETSAGTSTEEAYVTFFARYTCEQQPAWIYESSRFVRENNRWYYVDGVHKIPGRNEICPCGSQKKFKKCCAR